MKKKLFFLPLLGMMLLTTACGEKYTVNVRNLTGVEISEICITPETDKSDFDNLLTENLPANEEIELTVGTLTEEDIKDGFALQVTNAGDNSVGTFSMLYFGSGDTITFYLDDWGLAVGVNMTDEEIEEQKQRDHLDYLEGLEELENESESVSETEAD